MSLLLIVFLIIVISAGLAMQFAGLYFRKGNRPSCRKCAYDLSTHLPENCPECNAQLTQDGAVALGERRKRLAWLGTLVLAVGVLSLAFLSLQSPNLDRNKPLWMLRVELMVANDLREESIASELKRRFWDPAINARTQRKLAHIASERVSNLTDADSFYLLVDDAANKQVIPPQNADALIRAILLKWPKPDQYVPQSFPAVYLAEALSALIANYGIEFEALEPVIRDGLELGDTGRSQNESRRASVSAVMQAWWASPAAPETPTALQLQALFGDSPSIALRTRPRIELDSKLIHYEIGQSARVVLAGAPRDLAFAISQTDDIRVYQGENVLHPKSTAGAEHTLILNGQSPTTAVNSTSGASLSIQGLTPGLARIEIDVRSAAMAYDPASKKRVRAPWDERFDPGTTVLRDRLMTLQAEFEVVPPGGDAIELLTPGEGDVPSVRSMLESLTVSPLYYEESPGSGSPGPWQLYFHPAHTRHDQLAQIDTIWPDLDVAFRVVATQGEHTWQVGTLTARNILRNRFSDQTVNPTKTPTRMSESGQRAWDQPAPDLTEPVRLRLVPDPELAQETVDITAIYGGELDLGAFNAIPTVVPFRLPSGYETLTPIPSLETEAE